MCNEMHYALQYLRFIGSYWLPKVVENFTRANPANSKNFNQSNYRLIFRSSMKKTILKNKLVHFLNRKLWLRKVEEILVTVVYDTLIKVYKALVYFIIHSLHVHRPFSSVIETLNFKCKTIAEASNKKKIW